MHISVLTFPEGPYWLLFVPMLWGLYAMQVLSISEVDLHWMLMLLCVQVYWFKYIVRLLWRILVLGQKLEDNREDNSKRKTEGSANGKKQN